MANGKKMMTCHVIRTVNQNTKPLNRHTVLDRMDITIKIKESLQGIDKAMETLGTILISPSLLRGTVSLGRDPYRWLLRGTQVSEPITSCSILVSSVYWLLLSYPPLLSFLLSYPPLLSLLISFFLSNPSVLSFTLFYPFHFYGSPIFNSPRCTTFLLYLFLSSVHIQHVHLSPHVTLFPYPNLTPTSPPPHSS